MAISDLPRKEDIPIHHSDPFSYHLFIIYASLHYFAYLPVGLDMLVRTTEGFSRILSGWHHPVSEKSRQNSHEWQDEIHAPSTTTSFYYRKFSTLCHHTHPALLLLTIFCLAMMNLFVSTGCAMSPSLSCHLVVRCDAGTSLATKVITVSLPRASFQIRSTIPRTLFVESLVAMTGSSFL